MDLLEKYSKRNLPNGRLPTTEECVAAIEHPEQAVPKLLEYLRVRPDYERLLRRHAQTFPAR